MIFESRAYYQGMIDLNILEKGEDYRNLKKSYVIFICTFDQYGKGVSDAFTQDLEEAVQSVRQNEKWRLDYMTLQQEYRERYEEGKLEGKIEGRLEGKIEGKIEGRLEGKIEILYTGFHMTPSQISDKLSLPESEVLRILAELQE